MQIICQENIISNIIFHEPNINPLRWLPIVSWNLENLWFESNFFQDCCLFGNRNCVTYAPLNVNTEGGGVGQGVGIWLFYRKNVKCHSLNTKFLGKIPHPRDEILFLKCLVSGALYTSGDREMTQIHFGGII